MRLATDGCGRRAAPRPARVGRDLIAYNSVSEALRLVRVCSGRCGMATLADVARHAGVAASTVSYVLSGNRPVSAETKERVARSIELLGYQPHAGARALASAKSHVLAIVIPLGRDLYVPVMMDIAIAVTTMARRFGYDVLLLTNDEGPEGIRRVATSARAGRLCVEHLAGLGHREVAFIGEAAGIYQRHIGFAERTLHGIRTAAAEAGMNLVHRPCGGSYEAAAGVLARILEERPRTTGLIVQNEAVIPPLLSLLRTTGRIVPEDVSIVAVCPDQIAEQTSPQLSSVSLPAAELGARAVELLMARLASGGAGEVVLIPPTLRVRGSTGPAAGDAAAGDRG